MNALPLIAAGRPDDLVAWRDGRRVSAARFLAEVAHVADRLPPGRHLLNLCADRYRFAVALCAGILGNRISLLPPNHSPGFVERLREAYGDVEVISDSEKVPAGLQALQYPEPPAGDSGGQALPDGRWGGGEMPLIDGDQIVAHVFTSGSTGLPTAHAKRWSRLVYNVQSEALRLGIRPGSATTLVGTVPAQHMYGFESTVLLALQNRIAFDGGSPFYPADIVDALQRLPGNRILVTTPFHLRMLLAETLALPSVSLVVSATAPLSPELARQAETRLSAPLLEIYGCTEAGQLATRRPVDGDLWHTFRGIRITRRDDGRHGAPGWYAEGGHVETPTRLSDQLALTSPERFRLLGRDADMVNVAGKRTSIAYLNHLLCAIPGVVDGAYFNPDQGAGQVSRLTAFVVTDSLAPEAILAQLRRTTDAVFLPRPLHIVERLPRAATGKLPQAALAELAARLAGRRGGADA